MLRNHRLAAMRFITNPGPWDDSGNAGPVGPAMHATLACLCSAGPNIRSVSELKMEQLPIALFPAVKFQSAMIAVEPGDLLAVVSDGLPEVMNARDEEFGPEALGRAVVRTATKPLLEIVDRLVEEIARFGSQQDDQTVLLVRALGPAISV